ncbi:hypothetical protein [Streptomyces prunicolor]|uniref:hypothetical protein n=1 Tax=Streptomyces prunicolor TaxID=67348 RepID=UPI000361B01D|nr:hypothetical protein [Streptomyces prunicolor]
MTGGRLLGVLAPLTALAAAVPLAGAAAGGALVRRLRTHRDNKHMTALNCPNPVCEAKRRTGQYLCWDCWDTLPRPTRLALGSRDDIAIARLQILHRELAAGVPPHEIEIDL